MSIIEDSKIYVEGLFSNDSKNQLSYHNWKHTMNVFNATDLIVSNTDGVSEKDKEHLLLAALFHDIGYLESSKNHEERGALQAGIFLREKDYSENDVKEVQRLILATKLHHMPTDILEKIIIDADLSHLGREDYIETTYQFLSNEIKQNSNAELTKKDWAESCAIFLNGHRFLTDFAINHFAKNKTRNINRVKELVKKANQSKSTSN